jgi:hypothetical protein
MKMTILPTATSTATEANLKALRHPDPHETAAVRDLEPGELDAVGGGLVVGTVPHHKDPLINAFLGGFYRTCGCGPDGFSA